ncbi:hypothetical protein [Gemmata sp.]|uniref:hypothetical protein n=1 Tax=Gemmata sp. TaxID=1914242 RepID=UPI003F6F3F95
MRESEPEGVRIGELCDAASTPFKVVWKGTYNAGLHPMRPALPGQRDSARYSVPQVVAVRVARLLHQKFGVAPADLRDLISRIWHMSKDDLRAEFAAGRTCCVILGRAAAGLLFRPTAVYDFDAALKAQGYRAQVVAVSVEREYERVIERLQITQEVN